MNSARTKARNRKTAIFPIPTFYPCIFIIFHSNLANPSSDTLQLNQHAMQLLNDIYKPNYLYKKAGVMLADIETGSRLQADLFAQKDSPERDKLMQTLDVLNNRYGRGTVQLASAMQSEDWRMCRERLSPCYTTRAVSCTRVVY